MDDEQIKRMVKTVEEVKRKAQQPSNRNLDMEPYPKLSGYIDSWWVPLAICIVSGLVVYVVVLVSVPV